MTNKILLSKIQEKFTNGKKCYWVLLDPDDFTYDKAVEIVKESNSVGVDGFLIGGSLLHSNHFDEFVKNIKNATTKPVMLFPGDASQLSPTADAVLFLSLISGRNPANLIGEQVKGAPLIKKYNLEAISTGYMLIESGSVSTVEFMSNTTPIPRNKPMIAAAHALAGQYLGMSLIYLEAGSGAEQSVPVDMIKTVRKTIDIPMIVGGGIRDADTAREKIESGADIIVTGNLLRQKDGIKIMKEISSVIKSF